MREGRKRYRQVPRYDHVKSYEQQMKDKMIEELPFWLKPKKKEPEIPSIFAKIAVEAKGKIIKKPNIFEQKEEKKKGEFFWQK